MWNGKKKAVTFSFDDGVTQDIKLIEILDKYGLKCTFNLNSEFLGLEGTLDRNGRTVRHDKIARDKIKEVYKNHEVAVHTLTHPFLPELSKEEIIRQVETDRFNLSEICGYNVRSMAYPCGGENNDDRVAEIIRKHTGVKLARGLTSTYNFDLQENLLRFKPTVYYIESCLESVVDEFLELERDEPSLLYIWGHSYEMDAEYITWEKFEEICKKLSGHKDIFYGTNGEVLLNESVFVYQGHGSDKKLDEIIKDLKTDYFVLSPFNHKNHKLLSECDLMLELLDDFITRVTKTDVNAPVFIYGIFDKIDLGVDISPYLERLSKCEKQVFISVCSSYPADRFDGFGVVFEI